MAGLVMGIAPFTSAAEWELVWSDEFTQADGTPPNPAYWKYDIGGWGWGNGESQYYTSSTKNSRIENNQLVIELHRDDADEYPGNSHTSARLLTQGKLDWKYGRIEARIRVPDGPAGLWPAFWMLGADFGPVSWPQCGEIDIMEYVSRKPNEVFGTIHGPGYSGGSAFGNTLDLGGPVAGVFRTYSVEWEPNRIRWFLDGQLYHVATPASVAPNAWVFEKNFFIILNLAIGGNFGGAISPAMTYPQRMVVDYVRVYQNNATPNVIDLPGIVQAEDYAAESGVRFESTSDTGGGLNAGYLAQGDYLEFTLESPVAATYAIAARVASGTSATGRLRITALGQTLTSGAITNTGGWQTWTTLQVGEIFLPAGVTTLRATIESPGPNIDAFNLNWLRFTATDYAGDGIAGLLKRAFGLDVFARIGPGDLPVVGQVDIDGQPYLTLTYRRRTGTAPATGTLHVAGGFTYAVETSSQPGSTTWTGPVTVAPVGTPINHGNGSETATVRLLTPLPRNALFLRLKVSSP